MFIKLNHEDIRLMLEVIGDPQDMREALLKQKLEIILQAQIAAAKKMKIYNREEVNQ